MDSGYDVSPRPRLPSLFSYFSFLISYFLPSPLLTFCTFVHALDIRCSPRHASWVFACPAYESLSGEGSIPEEACRRDHKGIRSDFGSRAGCASRSLFLAASVRLPSPYAAGAPLPHNQTPDHILSPYFSRGNTKGVGKGPEMGVGFGFPLTSLYYA